MEHWLNPILEPLEKECALECDGLTRVISFILSSSGVKHSYYIGGMKYKDSEVYPHFWIVLEDGHIIDYRARMWLGKSPSIPHGVFMPEDYLTVEYIGDERIPSADFLKQGMYLAMVEGVNFKGYIQTIQEKEKARHKVSPKS